MSRVVLDWFFVDFIKIFVGWGHIALLIVQLLPRAGKVI